MGRPQYRPGSVLYLTSPSWPSHAVAEQYRGRQIQLCYQFYAEHPEERKQLENAWDWVCAQLSAEFGHHPGLCVEGGRFHPELTGDVWVLLEIIVTHQHDEDDHRSGRFLHS